MDAAIPQREIRKGRALFNIFQHSLGPTLVADWSMVFPLLTARSHSPLPAVES